MGSRPEHLTQGRIASNLQSSASDGSLRWVKADTLPTSTELLNEFLQKIFTDQR